MLPSDDARQDFLSNSGKGSASWLYSNFRYNGSFSNEEFAVVYKYRAGASLLPAHIEQQRSAARAAQEAQQAQGLAPGAPPLPPAPPLPISCASDGCGKETDPQGDHAFRCTCRRKWCTCRHNATRDVITAIAKQSVGTRASIEPEMDAHFARKPACVAPQGHRADILVGSYSSGDGTCKQTFLDVTIQVPKRNLSAANKKKIGSTATEASRKKVHFYNTNYEMTTVPELTSVHN